MPFPPPGDLPRDQMKFPAALALTGGILSHSNHLASYLLILPSISMGIFFETCASNKLSTPNSLCGCLVLNVQSLVHVMGTAQFHDLQTRGDLKPKLLIVPDIMTFLILKHTDGHTHTHTHTQLLWLDKMFTG